MNPIASLACALLLATHTSAPTPQVRTPDPRLQRVDSLMVAGHVSAARDSLARWQTAHPRSDATVAGADRAFALLLDGKLATAWPDAERAFQALALTYPVSPHAPEALLRLAQGLLASASTSRAGNSADRAASYLERLVADYPTSRFRPSAFLWLARAYLITDRAPLACSRLQAASVIRTDTLASRLISNLRRQSCG